MWNKAVEDGHFLFFIHSFQVFQENLREKTEFKTENVEKTEHIGAENNERGGAIHHRGRVVCEFLCQPRSRTSLTHASSWTRKEWATSISDLSNTLSENTAFLNNSYCMEEDIKVYLNNSSKINVRLQTQFTAKKKPCSNFFFYFTEISEDFNFSLLLDLKSL